MKKTITEWNGYIILTEKKIEKLLKELRENPFVVTTTGMYELDKAVVDKRVERIKAIADSMFKLQDNVMKVKAERQKANANNFITVAGERMTVATAIDSFIKRGETADMLSKFDYMVSSLLEARRRASLKYQTEKDKVEKELTASTRPVSEKERAYAQERIAEFTPMEFDPLDLEERTRNTKEKFEDFLADVNVQLNIFNATTMLEVDLDI